MIWLATLEHRVIDIRLSQNYTGFYTKVKSPAVLVACKESRSTIIKRYPLCFGSGLHILLDTGELSRSTLPFRMASPGNPEPTFFGS